MIGLDDGAISSITNKLGMLLCAYVCGVSDFGINDCEAWQDLIMYVRTVRGLFCKQKFRNAKKKKPL